ncbi:MAG TPA: 2-dehydropantoate 2-reductase [Terriglobales bacterium]|nr:2-dehydropantoate 2-reductase [Terriglobales bacterium]
MTNPRFAVYGAGGVGGYFAAVLARAGHWLGLIARGRQLDAIRESGLRVESPKGNFDVRPAKVTDQPADIGPVDSVILAVKAWQVPEAVQAMRPLLGSGTKVLPLQNGVEASDQLERTLGREHVLLGLCRIISSVSAPGCIRHGGLDPQVALGEVDAGPLSPNAAVLVEALRSAGAKVETPADMRAALWEKLLFIAAVSGVGAVARANIGEIRNCEPTRQLLQQVMTEVQTVAASRGVRLAADIVERTRAFVETIPASGTASMQRDIADGKPSELESIIGVVGRFGREAAVATPAIDYIYASLLPQERRARGTH